MENILSERHTPTPTIEDFLTIEIRYVRSMMNQREFLSAAIIGIDFRIQKFNGKPNDDQTMTGSFDCC